MPQVLLLIEFNLYWTWNNLWIYSAIQCRTIQCHWTLSGHNSENNWKPRSHYFKVHDYSILYLYPWRKHSQQSQIRAGGLKVDSCHWLCHVSLCFVFLSDISTKINFLIHILLERCNQPAIHDPPFSSDFVGFHGNV